MKTTTENNKLLAEFMEWGNGGVYITPFENVGYCNGEPTSICLGYDLLFHKSWDWLMPVVDKIEKELTEEFRVVIFEDECSIYQKTEDGSTLIIFNCIAEQFNTSKIEATYLACVEFVEWYNEQNK